MRNGSTGGTEGGRADVRPWAILLMISAALCGNFYVYDSIGPVADLLQTQRGFSDTDIGLLNAIYNLPNVVLLVAGGILVDRLGAIPVALATAAICCAGAALTAFNSGFAGMAAGRLLFGIGAETFNIATLAGIAQAFAGRRVAFAMGFSLAIGRLGSFAADMSPAWFASAYRAGWQPPLIIAAAVAAGCLAATAAWWWLARGSTASAVRAAVATGRLPMFAARQLRHMGRTYWLLMVLCVFWYATILAFRSTYAIKYFQHARALDLASAGAMNSKVFLAALFATPAFGWLCDRTGRYAPLLALGALLLPAAIAILALTPWNLWIATALIGVSYSLVPAVMWPLASRLIAPERFGMAVGLIWVVQNLGIAGANIAAGALNDWAEAGAANPAGYAPMMLFFGVSSGIGAMAALLLWHSAGRR
jgi:MFS family permease